MQFDELFSFISMHHLRHRPIESLKETLPSSHQWNCGKIPDNSTASSDMVAWYSVAFESPYPGHTWEPCWLILIHVGTSASVLVSGGVRPVTEAQWPEERTVIGWLQPEWHFSVHQRRLSFLLILMCSRGEKLISTPQIWIGNICLSVQKREGERGREGGEGETLSRYESGGGKMSLTF